MYCGIDIAKNKSQICIMDDDKKILSEFEIIHNKDGFEKLDKLLAPNVIIGMESTSTYGRAIYHFLKQKYNVYYIDTFQMRSFAKLHSSHVKNDKVDAKLIAYYLIAGFKRITLNENDEIKDLVRIYYKTLKNLTRYKFMFQNQINVIFPELEEHCYLAKTFVIANMLLKYPRPQDIASTTPEELQYELTKNLRRGSKYTLEYAKKLQELARKSVGIKDYPVTCFKYTITIMLYYEDIIKDITSSLRSAIQKTPYYPLYEDFGNNVIGLSTIIGETGDIRRFSTPKKFIRYIGFDVSEKQSGKTSSVNCFITKKGNKYLRGVLYTKVLSHIAYKTEIGQFCQKLLEKGKHPKQAIVGAARKLAVKTYYDMMSCHPETNITRKQLTYTKFEKKKRKGKFETEITT